MTIISLLLIKKIQKKKKKETPWEVNYGLPGLGRGFSFFLLLKFKGIIVYSYIW